MSEYTCEGCKTLERRLAKIEDILGIARPLADTPYSVGTAHDPARLERLKTLLEPQPTPKVKPWSWLRKKKS